MCYCVCHSEHIFVKEKLYLRFTRNTFGVKNTFINLSMESYNFLKKYTNISRKYAVKN